MSALTFPLETRISTYHHRGARFGANRSNGRLHAGCDLIVKPGTRILAMAKGRVVRGPYLFYSGTYTLEVEHAYEDGRTILVRYGEINQQVPQGISVGKEVERGQVIAKVGQLSSGSSMLHLEMYRNGTDHSKLTVAGTAYKRRADLLDPTGYLDKAPTLAKLAQRTGDEEESHDPGGKSPKQGSEKSEKKTYKGTVNNRVIGRLNMRESAVIDRTLEPVALLEPGEQVEVMKAVIGSPYPYGRGDLWYEVRRFGAPDSNPGLVVAYFLDTDYSVSGASGLDGPGEAGYVGRLKGGLNIREQPNTDAPVKATLKLGTRVEVLDQLSGGRYGSHHTDWLQVRYEDPQEGTDEKGYAAAFYIDIGVAGGEHDPAAAPEEDLNRWERVLLETEWAGCSALTANAELPGINLSGADASRRIAAKDVEAVEQMSGVFHDASSRFGVPAAVLAGIASRESHVGKALVDGWGDKGHGFGVMQVDVRSHTNRSRNPHGLGHVEQAAGIYGRFLQKMLTSPRYSGWEDPYLLLGATAAYNFGIDDVRTKERIDVGTTHDDYGSDTLARAKYFYQHPDLHELRD